MKLLSDHSRSEYVQTVYDEYGLREHGKEMLAAEGENVVITFNLGDDEIIHNILLRGGKWGQDTIQKEAVLESLHILRRILSSQ